MVFKGNDLLISLDGVAIAGAKSCDIETDCELISVSSPKSGKYRTYKVGRKTWQVRVNFLVPDDESVCLRLLKIGNEYDLAAYVRQNANVDKLEGNAILQHATMSGSTGGLLSGSWIFVGNDDIAMNFFLADRNGRVLEGSDDNLLVVRSSEVE